MTKTNNPVDRLFPLPQPEPAPGCRICADLDRDRTTARTADDHSRVSDCNIGLRAHGKYEQGKH
ncbi:hypothetical protein QBA54_32080 [Streptomyces sp. B21-108]|uniref:hypothetical protein n=1 Tax=Streptomyces sp. B21-108 TaxID=3039419 RepID=UPI002FF2107E